MDLVFVHLLFPNPCPCIVGLVIVLYQRWWLYKLYARQPLDQCQSGRSYLVECNYIALPCRHQASQCAAYNSPTEGVQCKQRHTVIFDPAQVWQSLICSHSDEEGQQTRQNTAVCETAERRRLQNPSIRINCCKPNRASAVNKGVMIQIEINSYYRIKSR